MKITLNWTLDTEARPTVKGYYLVLTPAGGLSDVWYDPDLGEWNCYTQEHVKENKKDNYHYKVLAWTDTKPLFDAFKENENEQTEDNS